mgnify:FL=1
MQSIQTKTAPTSVPEGSVLTRARCNVCRETYYLVLDVAQFTEWSGPNSRHIQEVFPTMSAGDRELILSSTCESCFDAMFSEEDDEEF